MRVYSNSTNELANISDIEIKHNFYSTTERFLRFIEHKSLLTTDECWSFKAYCNYSTKLDTPYNRETLKDLGIPHNT